MTADARMHLESVSKIYTATLILQLAQQGKLRVGDTVERWLPGLLRYDRGATDAEKRASLARVKDAKVRARLYAIATRVGENPARTFFDMWWIRWAAWQSLVSPPGRIRPAGADRRPARARLRDHPDGTRIDTSDWHSGVAAEGGIVSDARNTATFLTALMRGKLLDRSHVAGMEGDNLWRGGAPSRCAGEAYGWSGGGSGYKTEVWVNDGGTRVAVLLLNGRHLDTAQAAADNDSAYAMSRLYCGA